MDAKNFHHDTHSVSHQQLRARQKEKTVYFLRAWYLAKFLDLEEVFLKEEGFALLGMVEVVVRILWKGGLHLCRGDKDLPRFL